MRKLIASTFVSLDGIMQAPGGPDEDPTGGFPFGGWTFAYFDDTMDLSAAGFDAVGRELVLGRRTYEIFEAYWPYQPAENPIAASINGARKHVASRTLKSLDWPNSTLLGDDVPAAIAALKATPGPNLQVIGSGNLLQSLQAAGLVAQFHVWTYPVLLGRGKRLFDEHIKPSALRLVRTQTSPAGVVMSTYEPDGDVRPGSFVQDAPSEKELARRRKMAGASRGATGSW
ncbi:MAG: dihydrofolate reductase family protein [Burkholderiaceae bacterium]